MTATPPDPDSSPVPHLLGALASLLALDAAIESDSARAHLDDLLAHLRAVAAGQGVTIHPAGWSCRNRSIPVEPSDAVRVKAVFRRDVPAGTVVRIKLFGASNPDGVLQVGDVLASAGPPPHGLTDLESLGARAPAPLAAILAEGFANLRPAGAGGYLETAILDLYARFWDQVYPAWIESDAQSAKAFGDGIAAMMAESFGIESFSPQAYRDCPDGWILCPPGTRMATGRIARILRPGLRTADGQLRLPARAEAE